MDRFIYIDENNEETIDLIWLFEYAFNHTELTTDEIIIAISKLEQEIVITKIKNNENY